MRQRVVTALLLAIPVLLALALRTPWPLAALGLVAAFIGSQEADRLLTCKFRQVQGVAMVAFGLFAALRLSNSGMEGEVLIAFIATLVGVASARVPEGKSSAVEAAHGLAGLWVAGPLFSIVVLHGSAKGTGLWCLSPALMALVPVWAGDIAAIFAGRAFGKHLLAPKISPKKTVEGSVASLLAAILAAWLLGRLLQIPDARALGAGLAIGLLGQAGDLFESWLKRRAGVKDSGTLLPGHGGVLDRIDSVLFAAPAVALILLS